jgi:hypothetical protein
MLFVFVKKKVSYLPFLFSPKYTPKKRKYSCCVMLLDVEQKNEGKNTHTHIQKRKKK